MANNTTRKITNPAIQINNVSVPIVPNSFSYTEGLGEQTTEACTAGGGATVNIYADDATTKYSMCKFSIYPTQASIDFMRAIKINEDANVVKASDAKSGWTRTFMQAALISDYEVNASADGQIDLEFRSQPCI